MPCRIMKGNNQHMGKPMHDENMEFDRNINSYVIRMWYENAVSELEQGEWRGWIEHVQSRKRVWFRDTAEIVPFIEESLGPTPKPQ